MRKKYIFMVGVAICLLFQSAFAALVVPMMKVNKAGYKESIGYVKLIDTKHGLLIIPELHGLPPGYHGFHVHAHPSCKDHAMAAGGHLDPEKTGKHLGPRDSNGHLGDLPLLFVNPQGYANVPMLAPKLTTKDIINHSLMIHAGGDNYSDKPIKLGGGGARIACGVITDKDIR